MNEPTITFSATEREFLTSLLQIVLRDTRVEEHRTRAPSYREHILTKEDLVAGLLQKLGATPE